MQVPYHTDNEKADKYADLATKNIPNPTINNIPFNDIKNSINQKILSSWQNYWNSIPSSKKHKHIKKTIEKWHFSNYKTLQSPALESDTPFSHTRT